MRGRWPLLLIVIAAPVVAILTSFAVEWKYNRDFRAAAVEALKLDTAQAEALTLERVCASGDPALAELCGTYNNLTLMRNSSIWAGAIGLALFFGIAIAGRVAQVNRTLLWVLFAPGLHATVVTVSGLMLVDAALLIAAIYYVETAFLGKFHVVMLGMIGLGAVAAVFAMIQSAFSVVRRASTTVVGKILEETDAPGLWNLVRATAAKIGTLPPEDLVAGMDPNFFVTETKVVCLDGEIDGRTLFVSLPLCRLMSVSELEAIIGHELAHFKGEDTRFSERFYPVYKGATNACAVLGGGADDGVAALARLPGLAILYHFLASFSSAESKISRDREIAADREGAQATTALIAATALVKVHAYVPYWEAFEKSTVDAIGEGKMFTNPCAFFADTMRGLREKPSFLDGLDEQHTAHPTDSHPPLRERLRALGFGLQDIPSGVLTSDPETPASTLFADNEGTEAAVGEVHQWVLAKRAGKAAGA